MAYSGASHRCQSSVKVVSVAAGESHTVALSGDGCVYSWGKGMFGRLGTGSESDELSPGRVNFNLAEESLKFTGVAAGAYHSLALAGDGSVWCWGFNVYGQLGFNGENSPHPCLLRNFSENGSPDSSTNESDGEPLKICLVKAGGMMSLAIDNRGILWMWGDFPQPIDSDEVQYSLTSNFVPTPIRDFYGLTVVKVGCGNEHVVVLVSAGKTHDEDLSCYSWGNNSHGQLGVGDRESRLNPQLIKILNQESPWKVYEVACGASHTALLTHRKLANGKIESLCWTFGLGENGQLGHGMTRNELLPLPVKELPNDVELISVDCGLFHTSVVSSDGAVWSWGMERGLGLCPDACFAGNDAGDALSPLLIAKFVDPVQVACGAAHTVVVAQTGLKLWSWGRGRNGVLGNNKTTDCYAPLPLLWPPTKVFKQEEPKGAREDSSSRDEALSEKKDEKKMGNSSEKEDEQKMGDISEKEDEQRMDQVSVLMGELSILRDRLSMVEKYASFLHTCVFGKTMEEKEIVERSGGLDIGREWESMLEEADQSKLVWLEAFYRNMLGGVTDKLLKRKIQEIIKECLHSSSK